MKQFNPAAFKALRKASGHTQKSLGKALGTTEQHVQFWEYGKALPTATYLLRAMVLLDCTAADLLTKE
jgi:DNA-binding transcriptional regulator YiaG